MKNRMWKYGRLLVIAITGTLLFCTPFAGNMELANGLVMGKVCWFHNCMPLFAASVLLLLLGNRKWEFSFQLADGFVILMGGIVWLTYKWELNLEPVKLLFGGQWVVAWFLWRIAFAVEGGLRPFFITLLMGTGLVEAVWGLGQLHGISHSNHALFRLTGSFFNPGPFSGYLAILLPICVDQILRLKREKAGWNRQTFLYYFAWLCLLAILLVLPAGMSRSAWLAAALACGWVYWAQRIGWKETKRRGRKYRKQVMIVAVAGCLLGAALLTGIYLIKKDSADGRLFMWKITARALFQQPITGTGLGGFPAAYAEAQASYFGLGMASETEKRIAGCPHYAFNEYLQIGVEQGVGGWLLFLGWLGTLLYAGIRNRHIGATGGMLALALFACSSYPLQLPSFWFLLVFLATLCLSKKGPEVSRPVSSAKRYGLIGFVLVLAGCSFGFWNRQRTCADTYQKWNRMKLLYATGAYQVVAEAYESLHPQLAHQPEFLFEEAQCLSKTGRYSQANQVLERAMQLSGDPMIRYIHAKNEQALGRYQKAEKELLYAIQVLPERIYPYYLLVKLYAEPDFHQEEKWRKAAQAVLTHEPKVQSTAIREMREEVKKSLQKNSIQNTNSQNTK